MKILACKHSNHDLRTLGRYPVRKTWRSAIAKAVGDADYEWLHQIADDASPEVYRKFVDAVRRLRGTPREADLQAALKTGDIDEVMRVLGLDQDMQAMLASQVLTPLSATVAAAGAAAIDATPALAELAMRFDVVNPKTVQAVRTYGFDLIRQISDDTRAGIRQIVGDALQFGGHPYEQARRIRSLIGLTDTQAQAVSNFRRMLESRDREALTREIRDRRFDGTLERALGDNPTLDLSGDQITRMVERYASRMLDARAKNIARTETLRAANLGTNEAWRQAVENGLLDGETLRRTWLVTPDDRLCEWCAAVPDMNDDGVGLDEMFDTPLGPVSMPPLHPQCRCVMILSPVEKRLRKFDPAEARDDHGRWTEGGGGLYVSRKVQNAGELHTWARKVGIKNLVPPEKMHVTQVFSQTHPDLKPDTTPLVVQDGGRKLAQVGEHNAVVLHIRSPEMRARFHEAKAAGATYDYERAFSPHVTLSYASTPGMDLSRISPPTFPLHLHGEVHEPLVENWGRQQGLHKFNPNHDELGRFAVGPGVVGGIPKDKPVVLAFGGSFNPPHAGHVDAVDKAIGFMKDNGYSVEAAVVSPSPERLIQAKLGDRAYPLEDRVAMTKMQMASSPNANKIVVTGEPAIAADQFQGKLKRTQFADWVRERYPGRTVIAVTGSDQAPGHPPAYPSVYQGDVGSSHEGYNYLVQTRPEGGLSSTAIRSAVREGRALPAGAMTPAAERYMHGMLAIKARIQKAGFDPSEPRDEHGMWTFGGTTATIAQSLYAHHDRPNLDAQHILSKFPPDTAAKLAATQAKVDALTSTDAPVEQGGFKMANGKYTPDRELEHQRILDKIFTTEAVARATPAAGEAPKLILLGGRGGSGKTWFIKQGPVDTSNAIYLNADDIKGELPGYQGWNAGAYHEEATDVLDRAERFAKNNGLNVVIDATMKSESGAARRLTEFQNAGYQTEGYFMHTSREVAATRALQRYLNGGEKGRYVPLNVLLSNKTNERTFDALKPSLNYWELYDNTGEGGPKLIAKKNG